MKPEPTFTQGPWKTSTGENLIGDNHRWISADGNFIADLGVVGGPRDNEANASLIAAAPELLAALKKLMKGLGGTCDTWAREVTVRELADARAAIALATKGQP